MRKEQEGPTRVCPPKHSQVIHSPCATVLDCKAFVQHGALHKEAEQGWAHKG